MSNKTDKVRFPVLQSKPRCFCARDSHGIPNPSRVTNPHAYPQLHKRRFVIPHLHFSQHYQLIPPITEFDIISILSGLQLDVLAFPEPNPLIVLTRHHQSWTKTCEKLRYQYEPQRGLGDWLLRLRRKEDYAASWLWESPRRPMKTLGAIITEVSCFYKDNHLHLRQLNLINTINSHSRPSN